LNLAEALTSLEAWFSGSDLVRVDYSDGAGNPEAYGEFILQNFQSQP